MYNVLLYTKVIELATCNTRLGNVDSWIVWTVFGQRTGQDSRMQAADCRFSSPSGEKLKRSDQIRVLVVPG